MGKISAKQGSVPGVDAVFDVEHTAIEAVAETYSSLFGNIVRAQAEFLRLLSDRFGRNAQMFSRFAACRSPVDIAQLQLQLGSGAIADCMAEAQRMLGMFERPTNEELAEASLIPA